MSLIEAVTLLAGANPGITLLALALGSLLEYVFPPFPGDTITVAGAVLVVTSGLSLPATFLAILAGSLAGAAADYRVGVILSRWRDQGVPDRGAVGRIARSDIARRILDGADRASHAFAKRGEAAIVLNRFLPGIRAFLFVAAGMGGMRFGRTMLWAAVSAALWNAMLVGAGAALGANLDRIEAFVRAWGVGAWVVVGGAVLAWGVHRAIRKRRGPSGPPGSS